MKNGVLRKCCPKCGGKIVVSWLYQTSHDYVITKSGRISKRYTRTPEGSMEVALAACVDCDAVWEADEFWIDKNDYFIDYKY